MYIHPLVHLASAVIGLLPSTSLFIPSWSSTELSDSSSPDSAFPVSLRCLETLHGSPVPFKIKSKGFILSLVGFLFVCFCLFLPYGFFFFFWAAPVTCGSSQAGAELEHSCQPTPQPQPQPRQIQAVSATYTTAHSNARSLTH